jgi:predicted NAD-dependent protein-ADP-ribosyltransferase YbiA (DUF1768 family)
MASEISAGNSLGPVYFWRETEVPFGFLSQWYESPFEVDGVTYQSAEMWMMIEKARLFGDVVSLKMCMESVLSWRLREAVCFRR